MLKRSFKPRRVSFSMRTAPRYRPIIEELEDRRVPATTFCTVTATTDLGNGAGLQGDLRYCVNQANAVPQGTDAEIDFNIGGNGPFIISLNSQLPLLQRQIDERIGDALRNSCFLC